RFKALVKGSPDEENLDTYGGIFNSSRIADKYINAIMMLLSFTHYRLSLFIIEIFDCSQQQTGISTLDVDLSIECWSSPEHQRLISYAVVFGCIYTIGIPLFFVYMLYGKVVTPGRQYNREEKARYGYMYQKYVANCWWWELVLMFRKLTIVVWRMFTSGQTELLQASGAFFFFLFMWAYHMQKGPYVEQMLNKLDAVALTAHVVVMYAGTMFLTERLGTSLETLYAAFIIIVNMVVLVYIMRFVGREVTESVPVLGRIFSTELWIDYAWPAVKASAKYNLIDVSYKKEWMVKKTALLDYLRPSFELRKRQELVDRVQLCPVMGREGQFWAKYWLRESATSMREGEYYVRWLEAYTRCVDRSTFDQLIQGDWVGQPLEPAEQEIWKAAFLKGLRICATHDGNLIQDAASSGGTN
ncbi:unnamed protein product, partial [Chrysoparadoxa australica]